MHSQKTLSPVVFFETKQHLLRFLYETTSRTTGGSVYLALSDPQTVATFASNISAKLLQLQNAQPDDTPPDWQSVSNAIRDEASNTLHTEPWYRRELLAVNFSMLSNISCHMNTSYNEKILD